MPRTHRVPPIDPDPAAWHAAATAHKQFATRFPDFGINPEAPTGFYHLIRIHGETLCSAGVLVRTHSGSYLAHKEHFARALAALLMGQPLPRVAKFSRRESER